jgi:hypothetical protein
MGRRIAALLALSSMTVLTMGCGSKPSVHVARPLAQEKPNGPVYGGVPGALPPHFVYRYNELSVGWPVAPRHVQHPIRGPFADPRGPDENGLAGYHFGIDVNVDDERPNPGAPPGLSHRVYALDSGIAFVHAPRACIHGKVDVGHFEYWHVYPTVRIRQFVRAGQQIGWTCRGEWHVHVSEWQRFEGRSVAVNPLHRGGAFRPYVDTLPPVVSAFRFVTPPAMPWRPTTSLAQPDASTTLAPTRLHGRVELRVRVDDPQSFHGFLARKPAWPTRWSPYAVGVEVRAVGTGRLVLRRATFQEDQLPQTPYLVHYAPGTVEDERLGDCIGPPPLRRCDGVTWLRAFSRFRLECWDTRLVPDGSYRVTVRARDVAGNTGRKTVVVVVRNEGSGQPPAARVTRSVSLCSRD